MWVVLRKKICVFSEKTALKTSTHQNYMYHKIEEGYSRSTYM